MTSLQPPIVAQRTVGDTQFCEFSLDPRQPYLNDHRPGGQPLLGTVMGLELMAQAALAHSGAKRIVALSDITAHTAYLFADARAQLITVSTRPRADPSDTRIDCEVFSRDAHGKVVMHFTACIQPAASFTRATSMQALPDFTGAHEVPGEAIYKSFFHGPSFQVMRSVRWTVAATLGCIHSALPPAYTPAEHATACGPRLIEFGLQCAGLMTIANLGEQRVPHRIDCIERFTAADVYANTAWRAIALQDSQRVSEIRIVDEQGLMHLRIQGYRTVPLPFAGDHQALTSLRALLIGQPTGH